MTPRHIKKAIITKAFAVYADGRRERLELKGLPLKRPVDIEKMRRAFKDIMQVKSMLFEYEEGV